MKVSVFCFWFFRNFGRSCHNNCSCTYSKLKIAIMARKKKSERELYILQAWVMSSFSNVSVRTSLGLQVCLSTNWIQKIKPGPFFVHVKNWYNFVIIQTFERQIIQNNHVPQRRAKAKQRKRWELSLRSITAADGGEMAL